MDRDQAFAFLGLPDDATPDDVQTRADARRRQLELRLSAAVTPEQRRLLERALQELEEVRALALLDPRDPAAGLPGGAAIVLKAGTLLADRYAVKSRLGVGERGAVFRALDLTWGRDVALKVLVPEALLIPGTMDRLAANLRRHLGFAHPNVAAVYALGRSDRTTFIAAELVEGETLRQYAENRGGGAGLAASEIERVMRPVCAALIYAADRALHLNLKPENVLIANDGTIKVTDFGLDDVIGALPRGRSRAMTEQRRFKAPEQVRRARNLTPGSEPVDSRADQFAAAALVYFLATGDAPVPDTTDLAQRRPDLPSGLIGAVRRGLSSAPEARFETLRDFQAALFGPDRPHWRTFAVLGTALLVFAVAALAGWSFRHGRLPGVFGEMGGKPRVADGVAEVQQAQALRQRTEELKGRLQTAERALRARLHDARFAVQMREAAGSAAAAGDLAEARLARDMLENLSQLVVPQVFNSPDLLNAYNLLTLAADHLAAGRYHDAVTVLSSAEAVMTGRLADLREAERMAQARFGLKGGSLLGDVGGGKLRAAWEAAVAERRRFALAVDQGLVLIPAGNFMMGDTGGSGGRAERPVHRVDVPAFKLGRTAVTRAEYALCADAGACRSAGKPERAADPHLPITGVSWTDAQAYAAWLRLRTGEEYRLPSEAEWEYAARAGASGDYPWGTNAGRNRANCLGCGSAWDGIGPAPVASFGANAFGLHDMIGNVWQWTADCWYSDYSSAPTGAVARDELACVQRVLRGGSWDNDAWMARLSYRSGAPASLRQDINGFRIAKSME